jgi:hypothetical protein
VRQQGEPEFLPEDTDGAIALGMEERATCPQCGMLKVWCRDAANHQFSFEPVTSVCWPSERLETYRNSDGYKKLKDSERAATQLSVRFRDGHEPDLLAGLDLAEIGDQDDRQDEG